MRSILLLFLAFSLNFNLFGASQPQEAITLTAELTDCAVTPKLYEFDGFGFRQIQKAQERDGKYVFILEKADPKFYYVGPSADNVLPLILGTETEVNVRANCQQMRSATFTNSGLNTAYLKFRAEMTTSNRRSQAFTQQMARARGNEAQVNKLNTQMQEWDTERKAWLTKLKQEDPYFGSMLALNTYYSYANNGSKYNNELEYFINEFFSQVDFSNEINNRLPWVYEAFKSYATTLSKVRLPADIHQQSLERQINRFKTGSGAHRLALAGAIKALQDNQHENLIYFADLFVKDYEKSHPIASSELKERVERVRAFSIGGVAPDFTQNTVEGEPMSLSDLRGKVVLVDFWASWCGPCRKENPNVVRLYNRYKDRGFDVLGVSLDRTKDRWVNAIKSDKLPWHHVSDLKGWQNAVAKDYNVRSIPYTLLLDAEGRIVARGLRGKALEDKVAELLGE